MLKIFKPEINKTTSFSHHALIWIKSGHGWIEVDFETFSDLEDRVIFLSPDQPIKFLFGEFEVAVLEFPAEMISASQDYRVLFKHLISLGYIEFTEGIQPIFQNLLKENAAKVLDISTNQWFCQNPFKAKKEEYTVIFDLKDVIDSHFNENWKVDQFVSQIHREYHFIHKLVKNRLGLTVKNLAQRKLIIESQKDIAYTDKSIQEVAYNMGFNDPAYFNRFFKGQTQLTPKEFRLRFGDDASDSFIEDLLFLIRENHSTHRSTSFYADKMYMSIKTLSRKVKDKLNMTVGELVRMEVIHTAKQLLNDLTVRETAYELSFEEANHFSTFFKKYEGQTPSEYQSKKYNF